MSELDFFIKMKSSGLRSILVCPSIVTLADVLDESGTLIFTSSFAGKITNWINAELFTRSK